MFRRFCFLFSESSPGCWALLHLPCCPNKQGELSKHLLQNLRNKWPPHPVLFVLKFGVLFTPASPSVRRSYMEALLRKSFWTGEGSGHRTSPTKKRAMGATPIYFSRSVGSLLRMRRRRRRRRRRRCLHSFL